MRGHMWERPEGRQPSVHEEGAAECGRGGEQSVRHRSGRRFAVIAFDGQREESGVLQDR